jgi:hypothetical protein
MSKPVYNQDDEPAKARKYDSKRYSWTVFFALADATKIPTDFLKRRDRRPPRKRRLF